MTLDHEDIQAIAETTAPMVVRMLSEIMTGKSTGVEQTQVKRAVKQDLQDALSRRTKGGTNARL